jgi:hypothetical protein
MTDVTRGMRPGVRDGKEQGTTVVNVDVHEMLTSIKDLVPYLDEPWRSRVAVNDGFKGPPGNPYAFPQPTGVAIQDAVTDDGSPAGSKLDLGPASHVALRLQLPVVEEGGSLGQAAAQRVHKGAGQILDAADGISRGPRRSLRDVRDGRLRRLPDVRHGLSALGLRLPGTGPAPHLPQGPEAEDPDHQRQACSFPRLCPTPSPEPEPAGPIAGAPSSPPD